MTKFLHKKWILTVIALVLVLSMPMSAFAKTSGQASDSFQVSKILNRLTPEQIAQIQQLSVEPAEVFISPDIKKSGDEIVEVIVEFKHEPAKVAVVKSAVLGQKLNLSAAEKKAVDAHKTFKQEMSKFGIDATVLYEYRNAINGVAIALPANKVEELKNSSVVKTVWPNETVYVDPIKSTKFDDVFSPMMFDSVPLIGADELHSQGITGAGIKVGVIDTGIDYNHPEFTRPDGSSVYKGGWDFVNNDDDPMETTYEDWLASGQPETNSNGNTYYTDHGTHVSGTIAAQGALDPDSPAYFKGVAPGVELYAYKVLGPYGSGQTTWVLGGIDKAVEDGMDVINLSLGNSTNNSLFITSVALNNAMLQGVVAVTSAGNRGPNAYTVGSPGGSPMAITVGASSVPRDYAETTATFSVLPGEEFDLKLLAYTSNTAIDSLKNKSFEVVDAGYGSVEEFENIDVAGKLAFMQRGAGIAFVTKIANAKAAGAAAAIIYNNVSGYIPYYFGDSFAFVPTFNMTLEDGDKVKEALLANGGSLTVEVAPSIHQDIEVESSTPVISQPAIDDPSIPVLPKEKLESTVSTQAIDKSVSIDRFVTNSDSSTPTITFGDFTVSMTEGDTMGDFSSRGPINDNLHIKPDVTAPGVAIFSSIPAYINDPVGRDYSIAYDRFDGTSMASPHVAGVAALVLQAHPEYSTFDVKTAIMNTADPLNGNYSVFDVGAGRVNAYRAVTADVKVQVHDQVYTLDDRNDSSTKKLIDNITGSVSFGMLSPSDNGASDSRTFVITNNSDSDKQFNIAVTFQKVGSSLDASANGVTLEVKDSNGAVSNITVAASGEEELEAVITIPGTAQQGGYEGYITFTNTADTSEVYRIPFAAFYGSAGQKGIEYVIMDPIAFSPNGDGYYDATTVYFGFYNTMTYLELWLWSPEAYDAGFNDGYIGLIAYINQTIQPGYYIISNAFKGYYYAFDENGDLLEDENGNLVLKYAKDGYYTVDMYALGQDGKVYANWGDVFVDTEVPTITFDQTPGTYEAGPDGFVFSGKVTDNLVKMMQDEGYNVTYKDIMAQSFYLDWLSFDYGDLVFNPDGTFENKIPLKGDVAIFQMSIEDLAGNYFETGYYQVYKEGTQYGWLSSDAYDLYLGQEFTVTLHAMNVEDLIGAQFDISYDDQVFEIVDYKVNDQFKQYAEDHGIGTVEVDNQDKGYDPYGFKIAHFGTALLGGAEEVAGMDGDIALIDITFRVTDNINFVGPTALYIDAAKYVTSESVDKQLVTVGSAFEGEPSFTEFNVNLPPQKITGSFVPEAFLNEDNSFSADLSDIGATVVATSQDGKEYVGSINSDGTFVIEDVPVDENGYLVKVTVPGHFVAEARVYVTKTEAGVTIPVNGHVDFGLLLAGDINHDGVVDIYDVAAVARYFGYEAPYSLANARFADLNQDGKVNMLDVSFVVANFMEVNSKANVFVAPVQFLPNGASLEDLIRNFK